LLDGQVSLSATVGGTFAMTIAVGRRSGQADHVSTPLPARWSLSDGACHDARGLLLFRAAADGTVSGPDGAVLLRIVPDEAGAVAPKGFADAVASGALGGGFDAVAGLPASEHAAALARGGTSRPWLVQELPGRLTVAALAATPRGVAVALLPAGRINDPLLAALDEELLATVRRLGPLAHQAGTDGAARLVAAGGRVLAREQDTGCRRTIDVPVGPLPPLWLFGVLVAARHDRG
jgi:hypothetical protein